MKIKLSTTFTAACALLLASCATKMSNDPTGPPDATVSLDIANAFY